ncbi:MAG: hypothetical protein PUP91_31745 [Rhizonema sp. PD37]|nr:hypothetical protein [Rhizonema sp. PD37]
MHNSLKVVHLGVGLGGFNTDNIFASHSNLPKRARTEAGSDD